MGSSELKDLGNTPLKVLNVHLAVLEVLNILVDHIAPMEESVAAKWLKVLLEGVYIKDEAKAAAAAHARSTRRAVPSAPIVTSDTTTSKPP